MASERTLANLLLDRPSCAALFEANRRRRRRELASISSSAVPKTSPIRFNAEIMFDRWSSERVLSDVVLAIMSASVSGAREIKASALMTIGKGAEITTSAQMRFGLVRDLSAALASGVTAIGSTTTATR